MKLTYSNYFNKWRSLAANHKVLNHTEQENHFARVIRDTGNTDPFGRLNVDEVYNKLRNSLKAPMLIAIAYDAQVDDNNADSKKKVKTGTILLLNKAKRSDNLDDAVLIQDAMEELADELFGYLQEEYELAHMDGGAPDIPAILFSDISYMAVAPIKDNLCGVRIDFTWREEAESAFMYKPEKFNSPL